MNEPFDPDAKTRIGDSENPQSESDTSVFSRPTRIGKYLIHAECGQGGFGRVFRGQDQMMEREVAIKTLRPDRVAILSEDQLLIEARAMAKMRHENIVTIHDVDRDSKLGIYLVMDWIEGQTLQSLLEQGPLPPKRTVELLAQIAAGVEHAHEKGHVHRDLKPSNILLDENGKVYVCDFGLAVELAKLSWHLEYNPGGTLSYMSPEQFDNGQERAIDVRSDIWSLGILLYQMLTGELPFKGTVQEVSESVRSKDPATPREINQKLPDRLERVCLRCLQKDPDHRYQSIAEFRRELTRKSAWPRRTAIAAGIVGVGGLIAWAFLPERRPPYFRTKVLHGRSSEVRKRESGKFEATTTEQTVIQLGVLSEKDFEVRVEIGSDDWSKKTGVFFAHRDGMECMYVAVWRNKKGIFEVIRDRGIIDKNGRLVHRFPMKKSKRSKRRTR